jgi:hypothetical protein
MNGHMFSRLVIEPTLGKESKETMLERWLYEVGGWIVWVRNGYSQSLWRVIAMQFGSMGIRVYHTKWSQGCLYE